MFFCIALLLVEVIESNRAGSAWDHRHYRSCAPKEIADAILFLCSDQASFIHGQVIEVNGGFLMGQVKAGLSFSRGIEMHQPGCSFR